MSNTPRVVNLEDESYDVFIGRPSKWGNPFKIGETYSREEAIRLHAEWLSTQKALLGQLDELRGKTLGCYCKPEICHGDTLLRLANRSE
jgi:hypothetical protein